jgi:hypothetical protein
VTTLAAYLDRTDVTTPVGTTPIPGIATFLGVVAAEHADLKAQYGEAIDWCDNKLSNRDFPAAPPDAVVMGVYAYVKAVRDIASRAGTGIKKTKTGAREEEYGDVGSDTFLTPGQAAWAKIEGFALDAYLFASGGGM